MNEAPDTDQEPTGYIRLPWQLVGGVLFLFLAGLLAFGLFANRNLRPQLGVIPAPTLLAEATSTPPPVAAPAAVQATTPTVRATDGAVSRAATPTLPAATAAPTGTPAPTAEPTPTVLPTVEPALAREVGEAYVTFWRVRSQAVLELDSSHLDEVMAGDYLQNFEARLDDLKMQGRAIKTQVTLSYNVVSATNDAAVVHDHIQDQSFYVDPVTRKPITDPANDQVLIEFDLAKLDGVWKVVDSVTAE